MKSRFNKTKRLNNATSVQVMNHKLFEFIKKFTKSSLLTRMFAWPTISLGEITAYHPLCGEYRHIKKLEKSGVQVMSPLTTLGSDFTFGDGIFSGYLSVVNSKGDIVALTRDKRTFKVFKRSGESRILCEAPTEEHRAIKCPINAMDIDAKDNLYVIAKLGSTSYSATGENESRNFKLFIFDENGNKKLESRLLLHATSYSVKVMAISKDGFKIAIVVLNRRVEKILYIGNVSVELNSVIFDKSVSLVDSSIHTVRFSSFDGTIVAASLATVYIYTDNGNFQRRIETPIGHKEIKSVAINHATKRILVKTYQGPGTYSLLSFSETGELTDSLCLRFWNWFRYARLSSHPNGPVALVDEKSATLLQP